MISRLRQCLTYGNVMSTIAIFIALGSSAYAFEEINGSSINNRSIPGKKLKKHTVGNKEINLKRLVVAHAQTADRVSKLLVTGGSRRVRRKSGLMASASSAAPSSGSLVRMSVGEHQVLFEQAPFTFYAACNDKGGGVFEVKVTAVSTEAGWIGGSGSTDPHPAGAEIEMWAFSAPDATYAAMSNGIAAAPSGASLNLGPGVVGVHEGGSDCIINAYAIG